MDGTMQSRRDGGSVVITVEGAVPAAAVTANAQLRRALSLDPMTLTFDLSAVTSVLDEGGLDQLLDTGGLLEHWPGTSVVLMTSQRVEGLLLARYGSRPTVLVRAAPAGPTTTGHGSSGRRTAVRLTARRHLDPHPRAGRSARDFVTRTCLDWQLPQVIGAAVLVTGELVTNGLTHAGTALDVAISATDGRLLLGIHDGSDERPVLPPPWSGSSRGHGLHLVAGFSRAWGWLPRPEGGKVVWAVLDA
jgi:hypothetical protein